MTTCRPTSNTPLRKVRFAIIGAGFSGLAVAIRLRREGIRDFVIVERADSVGGAWRDNTYPGAACDGESHLYSYSFAPKNDWSRVFASQPEIWDYIKTVVADFDLGEHLRFGQELLEARWQESSRRWRVQTTTEVFSAEMRITSKGVLTTDGHLHAEDTIIFGTGFQATIPPVAHRIVGWAGYSLAQQWGGSMRAYCNTSVNGFPNLFIINGPNLGSGHTSMIHDRVAG